MSDNFKPLQLHPDAIEKVKKFNPTVGFLNPPYKSDKKRDPEKLAFVLNNSN